MSVEEMSKEQLELLSYKDITLKLLEEHGAMNTLDLFTKIGELTGLSKSSIEKKIGDYYTTLTTDKNFLLLEDGKWDLRKNHTSDKVVKAQEQDEEEEEEEEEDMEDKSDSALDEEDDYDSRITDDEDFDDGDDDLKDLVVLDEEELELEQ